MSFMGEYADVKAFINHLAEKVDESIEHSATGGNRLNTIQRCLTYHMIRAFQAVPKNTISFQLPREAIIKNIDKVDDPKR